MKELKVGSGTDPRALSTVILSTLEQGEQPKLSAIGASACNQAVKAIAIADQKLQSTYLFSQIQFETVENKRGKTSALVFYLTEVQT